MARQAQFPGRCRCGAKVEVGDSVSFEAKKVSACNACDPDNHPKVDRTAPAVEATPVKPVELRVRVQFVRSSSPTWGVADVLLAGPVPEGADLPVQNGRRFPVVGNVGNLKQGDLVDAFGTFVQHDRFGWQLKAIRVQPVVAGTDQALRAFLSRLPHIGPSRAEQILQVLGGREAVVHALENDPLQLTRVSGITEARALEIAQVFNEQSNIRGAAMWLAGLDVAEGLAEKILEAYGSQAESVLSEDPYIALMELHGVGWKTADDFARKLKVDENDPRRLAAATLHLLQQMERDGHTYATEQDLYRA